MTIMATCVLVAPALGLGAAQAATEGWSATVSCNHGTYTDVRDFTQNNTGTVKVKQISTDPQIVGQYHLESSLGNNTSAKDAGDGTSVSWSSVLPAVYKTWNTAATSVNCNGIGLGDGNSAATGNVTHS